MKLSDARIIIDKLDEKLISILARRFLVSYTIKKFKLKEGLPIKDKIREDEVYKNLKKLSHKFNFSFRIVKRIYSIILEESIKAQKE